MESFGARARGTLVSEAVGAHAPPLSSAALPRKGDVRARLGSCRSASTSALHHAWYARKVSRVEGGYGHCRLVTCAVTTRKGEAHASSALTGSVRASRRAVLADASVSEVRRDKNGPPSRTNPNMRSPEA
eukprot:6201143-Pleurochrysis_carterae.AAC.1